MHEKKIIVQLQGGIGNQLFQFAFARSLSLRSEAELIIDDESGFIKDRKYKRTFALSSLQLPGRIATRAEKLLPMRSFKKRLIKLANIPRNNTRQLYIKDNGLGYDAKLHFLEPSPSIWIEGVWANENYFLDAVSTVHKDIMNHAHQFFHDNTYRILSEPNSVGVHFRFFSDTSQNHNDDVDMSYYKRAFNFLSLTIQDPHFIIFSDNPDHAKRVMNDEKCKWSLVRELSPQGINSVNSDLQELFMMTFCRHLIASNSTFSWWATWLGEMQYKERISILPDPAIYKSKHWTLPGLIPPRWTTL